MAGVGGASRSAGRLAGQAGRLSKSRAVLLRSPATHSPTSDQDTPVGARGAWVAAGWRESAQRATARPQAIHTLQTPRSFS